MGSKEGRKERRAYQDSNADGDHELGDGSVPSPESTHRLRLILLLLLIRSRSRVLIFPPATIPTPATLFFSHKLIFSSILSLPTSQKNK